MKMRTVALTLLSLTVSGLVFYNAYAQKKQFYPSVVYITKSSFSMAVLYIQAFLLVFLAAGVFRKIFFGTLRPEEMEHLIERSWYAVTETCLAFTLFRDDFSPRFMALFTILLFTKSFHWLADDRIDYMERSPMISVLFHARAIGLMSVLAFIDLMFVNHAYNNTLIRGPSVQLVFGFEYAILLTIVTQISIKYMLHTIDMHSDNPWENKAVYLLYSELFLGFSKLGLYLLFLAIMMKIHSFPLFVVRPMYLTVREFKKALHDVFMSRRAIHNMNTLYPTATEEELRQGDNVCIICREEMGGASGPAKKLPCNHIFHTTCLRSWFQRQQTCPTCRMNVFRNAATARNLRRPQTPPQPQAAQAQQQPPQQQPPVQAQFNPFFQHFIVPPPPPPPPQPQPLQQNQDSTTTTTTSSTTTTTQSTPPPPFSSLPPFIPPIMPFGLPPPPPPMSLMPPPPIVGSLSGLTDEELRRMEGEGRSAVEARIKCLADIQTLLSAALSHMNHYLQVLNQLPNSGVTSGLNATNSVGNGGPGANNGLPPGYPSQNFAPFFGGFPFFPTAPPSVVNITSNGAPASFGSQTNANNTTQSVSSSSSVEPPSSSSVEPPSSTSVESSFLSQGSLSQVSSLPSQSSSLIPPPSVERLASSFSAVLRKNITTTNNDPTTTTTTSASSTSNHNKVE